MVAQTQFDPQNPDALFSPDQWLNQFSNFNNAALPWPSSYAGMPTNAMGQPIQPPPGMTLNSSPQPAAPQPAAPQNSPYAIAKGNPAIDAGNQAAGLDALGSMRPTGNGSYAAGPGTPPGFWQAQAAMQGQGQGQGQQQQPAAPNSWQNTMAMLANPGKVTTPGATVPATASAQPGPGSLQAFLQNWKPAQSGPGSGFQQGFGNALKGMGY